MRGSRAEWVLALWERGPSSKEFRVVMLDDAKGLVECELLVGRRWWLWEDNEKLEEVEELDLDDEVVAAGSKDKVLETEVEVSDIDPEVRRSRGAERRDDP